MGMRSGPSPELWEKVGTSPRSMCTLAFNPDPPPHPTPHTPPQVYQLDGDAGDAEREIRGLREQLAEAERSLQASNPKRRVIIGHAIAPAGMGGQSVGRPAKHRCRGGMGGQSRSGQLPARPPARPALTHRQLVHILPPPSLPQVAERAAEEKKREQAGLQKDRLLLEKRAKKKQADADKRVSARPPPSCIEAAAARARVPQLPASPPFSCSPSSKGSVVALAARPGAARAGRVPRIGAVGGWRAGKGREVLPLTAAFSNLRR